MRFYLSHVWKRVHNEMSDKKKIAKKNIFLVHSQGYQDSSYLLKIQKFISVMGFSDLYVDSPLWKYSKTEIMMKIKNWNFDKTKKINKLQQNLRTKTEIKLKWCKISKPQIAVKLKKSKSQIVKIILTYRVIFRCYTLVCIL